MTLNDTFERIFCISLDKRPDRWERSSFLFNELGIQVERVPAIDGTKMGVNWAQLRPGLVGLAITQISIFKHAQLLGLDNFLLLEDDIEFCDDFQQRWIETASDIPSDWDLFYLGGNRRWLNGTFTPVTSHVSRVTKMVAAHSVAFRSTVYQDMVDLIMDISQPSDLHFANAQERLNAYVATPHMTWQRPDYSDIQNTNVDYAQWLQRD